MKFLRAFDRWVARNTLLAYWLGIVICFALLLVAHGWGASDTQALRMQMATSRSTT
ncbi:hypothetical protein [Paraburkholderia tagetis]|uniref:Uncharacterized protein n=1 Tax=Paraburkholderia tagetis TaxID=2913261 RepID=A0A9X1RJH1_9BURK|nr:hypothetical protein [Paraburkholderia tagetis]MCG5072240.1 hypothetical protein [Paraburkholderia tagetis]